MAGITPKEGAMPPETPVTPPVDPAATVVTPPAAAVVPPEAQPAADAAALGEAGKKALETERAARKTAEKALADALKAADGSKTAEQKLTEQMAELNGKFETSERERQKLAVAAQFGLPPADHMFLTATDAEGLAAQAAAVAEKNKGTAIPAHQQIPGQGEAGTTATLDQQIAEAAAKGDWQAQVALQNRKLAGAKPA